MHDLQNMHTIPEKHGEQGDQHKQCSQREAGAEAHRSPLSNQPNDKRCQPKKLHADTHTKHHGVDCIEKVTRDDSSDANDCSDRKPSDQIKFIEVSLHASQLTTSAKKMPADELPGHVASSIGGLGAGGQVDCHLAPVQMQ